MTSEYEENQSAINKAQGGVNKNQGEVNDLQSNINEEQGVVNDSIVDDDDHALLAAMKAFRIETKRLRDLVLSERKTRTDRDKKVSKLFAILAAVVVSILLMGAVVYIQQRNYNHDRCIATQTNRRALKTSLAKLVKFATDATGLDQSQKDKIREDYRIQLDKDIPSNITC